MPKKLRYDAKEYALQQAAVLNEMKAMGVESVRVRSVKEMCDIAYADLSIKMSPYRMDTAMRKFLGLPKTGKMYAGIVEKPAPKEKYVVKYTLPKPPQWLPAADPVPEVETVVTRLARIEQKLNQLLNALGVA